MLNIPKLDFQPYFEVAWRRKWWIVIPFILILTLGAGYLYVSPKMYRATTLILVEAQRVPENYVQSTITESLQSRLSTISQQVNSRTNLERIIRQFKLYQKAESNGPDWVKKIRKRVARLLKQDVPEKRSSGDDISIALVERIRGRIDISIHGGGKQDQRQSFQIAFSWNDPQTAADVANAIASQFIEENLKVREEMAMGTTEFLDSEVERIRSQLLEQEKALKAFKEAHMGSLPDQLQSNLSMVNQLTEELNNLENRIATEKQQAIMLQNQIKSLQSLSQSIDRAGSQPSGLEQGMTQREAMRARLNELLNRYTEKHPDVVALKKRLARMDSPQGSAQNDTGSGLVQTPQVGLQQITELQGQLGQVRAQIRDYEQRIDAVKQKLQTYNQRVEETAQVEMELRDMERSYTTIQQRYQDLLNRKLNAQMAEELEKRQKGEQFRVIDPAIPPNSPFQPDVRKIAMMTVFLGLGLGGGLAFARESLDPAFYSVEEVESILGAKVVVSLPQVDLKG